MIFGRKRKAAVEDEKPHETDESAEPQQTGEAEEQTDWRGSAEPADPWAALDARDWRGDGPFDIDEVDLDGDPVGRMDLGSLIITPLDGMEVRFQIDQASGRATAVLLMQPASALELSLYAAPRSGGLWPQIRSDVIAAARARQGSADLAEGPFGVEVRRLMPVATPDGKQGLQPSRMVMVEGPRWALRGVVYGQAALETATPGVTADIEEVFRDTVVRRGGSPIPPGTSIPLTLPPEIDAQVRAATEQARAAQAARAAEAAGSGQLIARAQG